MKKVTIFIFSIIVLAMLVWMNCGGSSSPKMPQPPSNLWFSYGDDDLTVFLHWQQSSSQGIDGYRIYFENERIGSVPPDSLSFSDAPEYLGTYSVTAYAEDSESQRTYIQLPQLLTGEEVNLDTRGLCAFRFDYGYSWELRYYLVDYEGYDWYYGSPENEFLADSIDFYVDTAFVLRSPYRIVEEGRWSDAFHTRFILVERDVSLETFDITSVVPLFDEAIFSDSCAVQQGDMVGIVTFRNQEPSSDSDKTYTLIYITATGITDEHPWIEFYYKSQTDKNFRLVKEPPQ
ncbi:hypothetical protein DRQ33_07990 [bacterium]|nr:MAG: hypothetical protein DRQ33_07990 [bacterium]